MIKLKMEYTAKTCMGVAECKREEVIGHGLKDYDNVEFVVKTIKKLFASKDIFDACVDIAYDNDTLYGVTCHRFWRPTWGAGIESIHFPQGASEGTRVELDKLTAKEIREQYFDAVDRFEA